MKLTIRFYGLLFAAVLPGILNGYAIVFVHIGKELPAHAYDSLGQARLFNKSCAIYLLANRQALEKSNSTRLNNAAITTIPLESLSQTVEHQKFVTQTTLAKNFREGFWVYASERFLCLSDFVNKYEIEDLIHLETDVMIYTDFSTLLTSLHTNYSGIGITLENDNRCIPGFVYFRDGHSVKQLGRYFADKAKMGKTDMEIIAMFYHEKSSSGCIDTLPIIMPEYYAKFGFASKKGYRTKNPQWYYNNVDQFQGIFDGAAIGQYLGGIDPRNGFSVPGFIDEFCLFNCSNLTFVWGIDQEQRRVPFAIFNEKKYKIHNLHIHSKNLKPFSSVVDSN